TAPPGSEIEASQRRERDAEHDRAVDVRPDTQQRQYDVDACRRRSRIAGEQCEDGDEEGERERLRAYLPHAHDEQWECERDQVENAAARSAEAAADHDRGSESG